MKLITMLLFALPFVLIGALIVLWAYITNKLEHRFPRYYKFNLKLYDHLPKIAGAVIVVWFLYYWITSDPHEP